MASVDYTKVPIKEKEFHVPPMEEIVDGESFFVLGCISYQIIFWKIIQIFKSE